MRLKTNLRLLLSKHGLTASELSRATHVPKNTLSSWLAGTSPRKISQVKLVADCLGVTIDCLLYGDVELQSPAPATLETYLSEIRAGSFEVILRPLNKYYRCSDLRQGDKLK